MKKTITQRDYKQLKKLLRVAQGEVHAIYRTKRLIAGMLPQAPGLLLNIDHVVTLNLSARELVRLMGLKVKTK